jgi:hypothetical protein
MNMSSNSLWKLQLRVWPPVDQTVHPVEVDVIWVYEVLQVSSLVPSLQITVPYVSRVAHANLQASTIPNMVVPLWQGLLADRL